MQSGLPWSPGVVQPPLFIRPLTDEKRGQLEADRRTADAFRVRRAPSMLASARRPSPQPLAPLVGCAVQTVRHVIRALHRPGVEGWVRPAKRPKSVEPILHAVHCARLQPLLHQSPCPYGKATGGGTLARAAQVCHEPGVTERWLREERLRRAWQRLRTTWQRAKPWITRNPRPWPGMGCYALIPKACSSVLWTGVRSVR